MALDDACSDTKEEKHSDGESNNSGMDASNVMKNEEERKRWEKDMDANREVWKLATESGIIQYNDDGIMAILQKQNEALAIKKRLAKKKDKARRRRPKNRKKMFNKNSNDF
ncbi:uncharacterized protein DS421_12g372370 [Arachis hypogaea]|nr:uncharacterized protein DS421_12g372370 [Arachis hypogaea]